MRIFCLSLQLECLNSIRYLEITAQSQQKTLLFILLRCGYVQIHSLWLSTAFSRTLPHISSRKPPAGMCLSEQHVQRKFDQISSTSSWKSPVFMCENGFTDQYKDAVRLFFPSRNESIIIIKQSYLEI